MIKTQKPSFILLSVWDWAWLWLPIVFTFVLVILFYWYIWSQHLMFKGVEAIKNKNFPLAVMYFSESLEENTKNSWLYLNLALSYDLNQNPLKALQIYNMVASQFQNQAQFFSYFNQAELNGRLGHLDQALKNYQEGLEFKYKEKEIKKNIELLFKNSNSSKNQKNKKSSKNNQSTPDHQEQKKQDQQTQNQDNQKQDQQKRDNQQQNRLESKDQSSKNQTTENKNRKSEEFILKAIEQREGEVRAKVFKQKSTYGDKTEKDW